MRDILFISDLHLDEEQPAITDGLLNFLRREAANTQALYVLGDLFESWVGDDNETPFNRRIVDAFRHFSGEGARQLFFMHGNRDFLLGEAFAAQAGGALLAENTVIDLHGRRTLLLHGDSLCTDDAEYQKFRAMVRNPVWQQGALAMPLTARLALAAKIRHESKMHNANKAENIMDVNAAAVTAALRMHHADIMIHGHTHRPATHALRIDARKATRFVLGDWGSKGWCLRANAQGIQAESFTL